MTVQVIAKHIETIKNKLFHNSASGGPLKDSGPAGDVFTTAEILYEVSGLMWCDLCLRAKIKIKQATKNLPHIHLF